MAFTKDDKDTAEHMKMLINHFASGGKKANLRYNSDFSSLKEIEEMTIETLEEVLKEAQKGQYSSEATTPENLSTASTFVSLLDCIIAAKAKNKINEV